jgi:hypothetical protein
MGGITSAADAVKFLLCGATAVQVGTQNYLEPGIAGRRRRRPSSPTPSATGSRAAPTSRRSRFPPKAGPSLTARRAAGIGVSWRLPRESGADRAGLAMHVCLSCVYVPRALQNGVALAKHRPSCISRSLLAAYRSSSRSSASHAGVRARAGSYGASLPVLASGKRSSVRFLFFWARKRAERSLATRCTATSPGAARTDRADRGAHGYELVDVDVRARCVRRGLVRIHDRHERAGDGRVGRSIRCANTSTREAGRVTQLDADGCDRAHVSPRGSVAGLEPCARARRDFRGGVRQCEVNPPRRGGRSTARPAAVSRDGSRASTATVARTCSSYGARITMIRASARCARGHRDPRTSPQAETSPRPEAN